MVLEFNSPDPSRSHKAHDSISSDRLRKAIERNRAKQSRRSIKADSDGTLDLEGRRREFKLPGNGRGAAHSTGARRSVARPGEQEFTTSVRRNVDKAPANVSYAPRSATPVKRAVTTTRRATTTSRAVSTRKRASKQNDKKTRYFVTACWLLLGAMCLRLVFSRGGVIDYYANKGLLDGKVEEYKMIQVENNNLVKEIKKDQIKYLIPEKIGERSFGLYCKRRIFDSVSEREILAIHLNWRPLASSLTRGESARISKT